MPDASYKLPVGKKNMARHQLPIGIQDFETLRREQYYYVDKTSLIQQLVKNGRYYFLSRPRRFGKSLLLDTIKELFEGKKDLFEELAIYNHWNWSVSYPVVRLSFDGSYEKPEEIEGDILEQLEGIEEKYDLPPAVASNTGPRRLRNILRRLHQKTGQRVVILIDEYDKPILDCLDKPKDARTSLDYLRGFYGIIKGSAEHVRFVFVTGVSMFSKVSLFSGLNNLNNISLDPQFATICGYTEADLNTVFKPELGDLDRDRIRTWYNGYSWLGDAQVYNPFNILLLLQKRKFEPYWFETGTPKFLLDTLKKMSVSSLELEGCVVDKSLISKFDVDDIRAEALMFQTGYLTISKEFRKRHKTQYHLTYPNQEVRLSLNDELIAHLRPNKPSFDEEGENLRALLKAHDFEGFEKKLQTFFSTIPYLWNTRAEMYRYEAWYANLLSMSLLAVDMEVKPEEATSHGRADLVVIMGKKVFLFEFKMAETEAEKETKLAEALTQMRNRKYGEKYRGNTVQLVAVACGSDVRNILEVRAEPL